MTSHFSCHLSFSPSFNPLPSHHAAIIKLAVRGFLYDEVRPVFKNRYPAAGVEPTIDRLNTAEGQLLKVTVGLPLVDNLASLTSLLTLRLIEDILAAAPKLRDKLAVEIGPVQKPVRV